MSLTNTEKAKIAEKQAWSAKFSAGQAHFSPGRDAWGPIFRPTGNAN
jgi:hypothetical protein